MILLLLNEYIRIALELIFYGAKWKVTLMAIFWVYENCIHETPTPLILKTEIYRNNALFPVF